MTELQTIMLRRLSAEFDVDTTPARAAQLSAAVVRVADVALIVLQPSGPDVWASAATVKPSWTGWIPTSSDGATFTQTTSP